MASLDELLALLPDNTTGEIDAADLRAVVTGLWEYTATVQTTLNDVVVRAIPDLQARTPKVGQVASDGSLVGGPEGWTSTYDAETKLYTVHHDLGTEAYAVVVTPLTHTDAGQTAMVASTTATSFTYGVWHSGVGDLHGTYANFIVGLLL